mmetsp:Transcript_10900/g.31257  ORF Transcript_10900/g.31257 Transcript_10900/m.31257 type:complete len:493 (-) Transcript_10900:93-1571(-)|eukprot:CAMPEP_0119553732 /NCGR_PEP_ID=MMETSP1352-20130426/6409_1 /TAXON_ID=265584 /ORGANISM="Stauroneis constricta, Strain CCMP1120" /LENGTH=492 /DNA_ID=CAMNT_0007600193 /DNA_START=351 /DNA_END=1829 /DNA_ORIENTATION=-
MVNRSPTNAHSHLQQQQQQKQHHSLSMQTPNSHGNGQGQKQHFKQQRKPQPHPAKMNSRSPGNNKHTAVPAMKLHPAAVRERARGISGCKELVNTSKGDENVISFMVGLNHPNQPQALARINVYYITGTIGTQRVVGGQVRQSFRRNITSLDVMERLMRHPEKAVTIDEHLIGFDNNDNDHNEEKKMEIRKKRSLQKELELADVGMCILQGERDKLTRHIDSIHQFQYTKQQKTIQQQQPSIESFPDDENDVPMNDNDESSSSSSNGSLSGMEFQFSLPADVMTQVDQCLRDITRMDKLVKGVATNGRGTVFLYGNGGVAYTPSIPRALYQKLRQLRNSTYAARPSYVSLGTRDRYFVAFNDFTADWKGPKALDKILKRCIASRKPPLSVSFGSTYDTFFVVFHDGSWEYQGRGIPSSLEEKLASRDARADLVTVNLGPSGEWFLKAKNGRMWWSGISDDLDKVISHILQTDNYLHFMDFGEGGSYFVSYDD